MPRKIRPDQRQRKAHKRSRGGCGTCKVKHIRCDEQRPKCSFCSKRGSNCDYGAEAAASTPDPEPATALRVIKPKISYNNILPVDDFVGYPIQMASESRRLFTIPHHDFSNNHSSLSDGLVRAWSEPLLLRCSLLVMAGQLFWGTGSLRGLERPLIEHKVEVIREVNRRLASQPVDIDDVTVSAILSLAIVEMCLGATQAARYHISGLNKLDALKCSKPLSAERSLACGIAKMHFICKVTTPVKQLIAMCATPRTHEVDVRMDLRLNLEPIKKAMQRHRGLGELTILEALRIMDEEKPATGHGHNGQDRGRDYVKLWDELSRSLARDNMDPFVLRSMFDRAYAALAFNEAAIGGDPYLAGAWLWTAFQAHVYASAIRQRSALERRQAEARRRQCQAKFCLAARRLGVRAWPEAKAVLARWMWAPDDEVEAGLRARWEEAVPPAAPAAAGDGEEGEGDGEPMAEGDDA